MEAGAVILDYHEVVNEPSRYLYAVTTSQLREHVNLLLRRKAEGHSETAITFDDGLNSHRRPAADVLEDAGFRGTFFVNPAMVGTQGFLNTRDLRELSDHGHDVESHGWSHVPLPRCGPAELRMELRRSKETLEDWLGREVDAIAVPGGAYNKSVLRAAADAGYRRLYTSDWWQAPAVREGIKVAGRLMIRNSFTAEKLEQLLATEGRRFSAPRLAQRSRRAVRAMLGFSLYHTLWSLAARRQDQL
jgi:peptidoglycan/xylan/chitin deacetylase (PgdA/CDA1 family)